MSPKKGKPLEIKSQRGERRIFSEPFRRAKVREIEQKLITVQEISILYEVSKTSVYKWLDKYSLNNKRGTIQVVQMESEAEKTKQLQKRIAELESALGRKQMELDYLNKLVELASDELQEDIKKNFGAQLSNGLDNIEKSIHTKYKKS